MAAIVKRRTKKDMQAIREALYAILEEDHPMTVRQVFYRAVSAKVVDKSEKEYKGTVGRLLLDMRVKGEIPFHWIADNTRWMRKPTTYSGLDAAVRNSAESYRRALWDDQDVYVEVWTEKDALAGVLLEETAEWDVPLMVSRGFASVTYLYEAAGSIKAECKPAHLYYFGDWDPSGVLIDPSIERRLHEFAPDAEIYFERVAVRVEQIEEYGLETRPTKRGDNSHARNFEGDSVEVDAIPPQELRRLVRECIEQHIDRRQLELTKQVEEEEKATLEKFARRVGKRK
jgi:hypothetical protein